MPATDPDTSREQILTAANVLFNARGIRAVSMHDIRDTSGVPLNRLYKTFPSKDALVEGYLKHRDHVAVTALRGHLDAQPSDPHTRITAAFAWLYDYFREPDFRGCIFTNTHSELGSDSPAAPIIAAHKAGIRALLTDLARKTTAPDPEALGAQLQVLWEGALTLAGITRDPTCALQARATVETLLSTLPPSGIKA